MNIDVSELWRRYKPMSGYSDADPNFAIRLKDVGTYVIALFAQVGARTGCKYWQHGSRVRIHVPGQRDGERWNRLDIEHDPESNTLIIHGDRERVLHRRWAMAS